MIYTFYKEEKRMNEIQISMSELRQHLGDLVNRAAYGRERVILVSHGQPKAAIIGVDDLRRLRQIGKDTGPEDVYAQSVRYASQVREKLQGWQQSHDIEQDDSSDILSRLRGDRDEELGRLR
jgi:prevent-host-death family protein